MALSRCHCRSCRLATGAPAAAWAVFDRGDFELLQGAKHLGRFRSSPAVTRTFCAVCGTSIGYEPDDAPSQIEITSATFDDPNLFPPSREVWLEHRLSWEPVDPALKHHARGSEGR